MSQVARYGRMLARPGRAEEVAEALLAAADELRSNPGCELYLVSRERENPDVIWVTELWRSREDLDAALERLRDDERVKAVRGLVADGGAIELNLLGGKGARAGDGGGSAGRPAHKIVNLTACEDMAVRFGYSELQEARFPARDLGLSQTGMAHLRIKPDARQPFAHRHGHAEEVYLVLAGSGRVKLDDELADVGPLDAIRVAPEVTRAFEAGPEGLELLAFSASHPGDAELVPDWWPD